MKFKYLLYLVIFSLIFFMTEDSGSKNSNKILLINQPEIAFSFDDPQTVESSIYTAEQRNDSILKVLEKYNIKDALFV